MVLQSLSARRVWIEIFKISLWYSSNWSLSARRVWIEIPVPCQWHPRCQSLSARRVWIEIAKGRKHLERLSVTLCEESVDRNSSSSGSSTKGIWSLSARRVWIEIPEVRGFKHKFPDNSHIVICANLHNQGKNVYILLQSIPFNIKQYFQQYFTLKISYTEKCKFTYCFITNPLTQIENLTIIMAQQPNNLYTALVHG